MKIKLSPVRMDEQLTARAIGDSIVLNGVALDFSPLQEGDTIPLSAINNKWIAGDVARKDGVIHASLLLPHGANAPHETRFPAAFYEPMTVTDGPVPLPPYDAPPADDVQLPEPEPEVLA